MSVAPELSIVMPCLNEAETIAACIGKARAFFDRCGVAGEIVIGDNGSTDGSAALAQAAGARVVPVPLRGYGAALHGAMRAARGRYIIMGDADDSYDFANLDGFLSALRAGAALVMGNRFAGGIAPGAMPWKNRHLGNPALSALGRLFFGAPVRDFHCGLRGLTRETFERLDLRTTGMEFASEMVIKASLLGLPLAEVPTRLARDGRSRPPHLRPWRDGWRHLRFMVLFSPDWLFLYPGLTVLAAGLAVAVALLAAPQQVGGVRLGLGTLIYAATAIELGAQATVFAVLSRAFAVQEGLRPPRGGPRIPLEAGLLAGFCTALLGVCLGVAALRLWSAADFGRLDVERIGRLVIASSVALSLGLQTILSSFLLGVMRLSVRPHR
jgi:hypothetical protein